MEGFDLLLGNLRDSVKLKLGQNTCPSLGIMDSQKYVGGNNRALNGIDGGKISKRNKTTCGC
jgi:hypothetical protein